MRVFALLAMLSSLADADPLRGGATVGGRVVDLAGQLPSDPAFGLAAGAVLERRLDATFSLAGELGLARSGNYKYSLLYATLPLLARVRWPVSRCVYVRATAGALIGYRLRANLRVSDDDGPVYHSVRDHVNAWDLAGVAGIGFERGSYFADIRYARGLFTVHADQQPLAVYEQELGLWLGAVR